MARCTETEALGLHDESWEPWLPTAGRSELPEWEVVLKQQPSEGVEAEAKATRALRRVAAESHALLRDLPLYCLQPWRFTSWTRPTRPTTGASRGGAWFGHGAHYATQIIWDGNLPESRWIAGH